MEKIYYNNPLLKRSSELRKDKNFLKGILESEDANFIPMRDDENYFISGKEEIKSKIGSFNCYIVKPFHQGKSLLKNEGDMKIWISDSEKRLPIRIQIKMKFGSMKLDLISIN